MFSAAPSGVTTTAATRAATAFFISGFYPGGPSVRSLRAPPTVHVREPDLAGRRLDRRFGVERIAREQQQADAVLLHRQRLTTNDRAAAGPGQGALDVGESLELAQRRPRRNRQQDLVGEGGGNRVGRAHPRAVRR